MMKIFILLLLALILILIIVGLILGPQIAAHAILVPMRLTPDFVKQRENIFNQKYYLTPAEIGLPFEDITITTPDSVELKCWFVKNDSSNGKTLVLIHGIGDSRISWIVPAKEFHDKGFNIFLFDLRAHGVSGGNYCTYGAKEKYDVKTVLDYLEKRNDVSKIGVLGNSLGAAVAIQTCAMDGDIDALVAQSSFRDLRTIIRDYGRKMISAFMDLIYSRSVKQAEKKGNFNADDVSPLKSIKNIHVPILFISASNDENINPAYTQQLYESANEPKENWIVNGAGHNTIPAVAGKEYYDRIAEFFNKYLK